MATATATTNTRTTTDAQLEEARRIARIRSSFKAYIEEVRGWTVRPHQLPWVASIEALIKGTLKNKDGRPTNKLLILAPPGSGKSDTAIEAVEWVIGREVERGRIPQCGYIAYADDVAAARSVAIRNTIEYNDTYHEVFPSVRPAKSDGWGQSEWFVERKDRGKKDATLRAAGITGGILSYRFPTLIVIDDPNDIKMEGPADRERVWRTYSTTIKTRGLAGVTPMLLVCTRWAEDDLAGRVMEAEDDWCIVHTKALSDDDESYWPPEVAPDGTHYGISAEELDKLRDQELEAFITQYQAMPPSAEASVFKYWDFGPPPNKDEVRQTFLVCDTAYTDKASSSYQAVLLWIWTTAGRIFLSDVYRRKVELPRFMADLREMWGQASEEWGSPPMVLVENRASGPAVVQILRQTSSLPIKGIDIHNRDLVNRAAAVSKWFESHRIYLPDKFRPWLDVYLNEMRAFPHGKYNDQVSATILIVEYLFNRTHGAPPKVSLNLRNW